MADRWFKDTGHGRGDRDLDEQLKGLGRMFAGVRGKRVLDLGCAEGLISLECLKHGAAFVHGIEIVPGHIEVARGLFAAEFKESQYSLQVADLALVAEQELASQEIWQYDIVLALAVLHKLNRPQVLAKFIAATARELAVIRYPGGSTGRVTGRGDRAKTLDVPQFLLERGFLLEHQERGPRGELTAYFRRR